MSDRTPSETPQGDNMETIDWQPDEQVLGQPETVFTPEQADAIQKYIWQIKDMLGLQGWDVYLTLAHSTDDCNASVHPVYGRYTAGISVNKNWLSYSREVQRNTIIHELLHVMHHRQTEVIRTTKQRDEVWITFNRETELMVDHLATSIEDLFPLPPQTVFEQVMDDLDNLEKASAD
ncbi:MAG: hypothetical protein RR853_09190 [Aurantimicrobium sp.]|uniref:hypothetical protein n=1 Tax=Aurantimicrobium sp. TaxID=1930784 RepID=UPI002FC7BE68